MHACSLLRDGVRRSSSKMSLLISLFLFGVASIGIRYAWQEQVRLPVTAINAPLSNTLELQSWRVYGPFPLREVDHPAREMRSDHAPYADYLSQVGIAERWFNKRGSVLAAVNIDLGRAKHALFASRSGPINRLVTSDDAFLDLKGVLGDNYMSAAYAATVMTSSVEQAVAVFAGSADGMQCWLNNEVVIASPLLMARAMHPYSNIGVVHLRAGSNVLLCKIVEVYAGVEAGWGLRVAVMPLATGRQLLKDVPFHLLNTYIAKPGERIQPQLDLYSSPTPAVMRIADAAGKQIVRSAYLTNTGWSMIIPATPPGVYTCKVTTFDSHFESRIYIGTRDDISRDARRVLPNRIVTSQEISSTVAGWQYRVKRLLDPVHLEPSDVNWQRKLVYVTSELQASREDMRRGRTTFLHSSGFRILSYKSRIDDSVQYYGIHVPASGGTPHKRLPVVISLLPALQTNRPYLDGLRVSDQDELERLDALSDRYNIVILEPQGRGNSSGWPIQEADIQEALEAAAKNYSLDMNRVYMIGYCEAGREALLFSEHFASRIAAVAVYAPTEVPAKISEDGPPSWFAAHDISSLFINLFNTPVLFFQGDKDTHVPLPMTKALAKACDAVTAKCLFQILPGIAHSSSAFEDVAEPALQFLLHHRRTCCPGSIALKAYELRYAQADWLKVRTARLDEGPIVVDARIKNGGSILNVWTHNVESLDIDTQACKEGRKRLTTINVNGVRVLWRRVGRFSRLTIRVPDVRLCRRGEVAAARRPIADAFTAPLMMVVGTGGTRVQRMSAAKIASALQAAYRNDFFVNLPERKDFALNGALLRRRSLIIVGEPRKRSVLSMMVARHVVLRRHEVSVDGREVTGARLVVVAIEQSSTNPDQAAIMIQSNSPQEWHLDDVHLWSLSGYYSTKIVDSNTGRTVWAETSWQDSCAIKGTAKPDP